MVGCVRRVDIAISWWSLPYQHIISEVFPLLPAIPRCNSATSGQGLGMVSRAFREHVIILIGLFLFLLPYSMAWAFSGDTDKHNANTAESGLPRMAKPNIVWIVLDACRAQNLSCYGYNRQTSPNIDNLASSGVLFASNTQRGSPMIAAP